MSKRVLPRPTYSACKCWVAAAGTCSLNMPCASVTAISRRLVIGNTHTPGRGWPSAPRMVPVSKVSWVPSAGAVEVAGSGRLTALAGPANKEATLKRAIRGRVKADMIAERKRQKNSEKAGRVLVV